MDNKGIARSFALLAKLMELKGENPFKIRSYQKASGLLSKLGAPLSEMSDDEIGALEGVGTAINGKIRELLSTGQMNTLERYKAEVPEGIQELVMVKGIGVKKVKISWERLGIESATELLYACNENRLVELKGFGKKTQRDLKQQLEYYLSNRSHFLYPVGELVGTAVLSELQQNFPDVRWEITGSLRRKQEVLDGISILMEYRTAWPDFLQMDRLVIHECNDRQCHGHWEDKMVNIIMAEKGFFEHSWFVSTGPEKILVCKDEKYDSEREALQRLNYGAVPPECRTTKLLEERLFPDSLVTSEDIKGVIHCHTTYSDGINTVEEMAQHAQALGYQYIAITDHSKIAVYADGLDEEKVYAQWEEIDALNSRLDESFRVIRGIECDILGNGDLDYDEDLRAGFELVIASIHTGLKMDRSKATERLIKAIENPQTNMLGHPTGRLLLGREGYPIDVEKVIDACAANQVAIEINASPYRLDLDWRHIYYAVDKGVMMSINPDAHSREAIEMIRFGVIIARKGWMPVESCLNAREVSDFLGFCRK